MPGGNGGNGNGHDRTGPLDLSGLPFLDDLRDDLRKTLNDQLASISSLVAMSETSFAEHVKELHATLDQAFELLNTYGRKIIAAEDRLDVQARRLDAIEKHLSVAPELKP